MKETENYNLIFYTFLKKNLLLLQMSIIFFQRMNGLEQKFEKHNFPENNTHTNGELSLALTTKTWDVTGRVSSIACVYRPAVNTGAFLFWSMLMVAVVLMHFCGIPLSQAWMVSCRTKKNNALKMCISIFILSLPQIKVINIALKY